MGMADFYLKFRFDNNEHTEMTNIYEKLKNETMFISSLHQTDHTKNILIECKFDNILPTLIVLYEIFNIFRNSIVSVETFGAIKPFKFADEKDFIAFVYAANRNKMLSYYKDMGYLAINVDNYYKSRKKLKKYYKKLKG